MHTPGSESGLKSAISWGSSQSIGVVGGGEQGKRRAPSSPSLMVWEECTVHTDCIQPEAAPSHPWMVDDHACEYADVW
jgi:hypothetical protein